MQGNGARAGNVVDAGHIDDRSPHPVRQSSNHSARFSPGSDARYANDGAARSRLGYLQSRIWPVSLMFWCEAATNQKIKKHIAVRNCVMATSKQSNKAGQVVSGLSTR
ncbi:hypothetical protein PV05_09438 [Exophiala xenobiotica]|uniref:Uncharacterized protein n=1 Tax=Exophiala xenobiotica TaxID=348802 RepID=A0A0D2E5B9_9EURO|nr:uncharacterized protein PV05_09438 [Exophiala xenobiotica]KIW50648.1 hypothetical protein PV05_09438 [Exophiala xenobiotica]